MHDKPYLAPPVYTYPKGYIKFPDGHVERKSYIGRNEKCPCGSGLKFKKCCIDKI